MRRGVTLVEVAVVLSIAGLLLGVSMAPLRRLRDASAVRSATAAVSGALALARSAAIARGAHVEAIIHPQSGRVTVVAGADTLSDERVGPRYGVALEASALRVRYAPTGHGFGLSNTRVIARRGAVADTLTVSRLGRVRR